MTLATVPDLVLRSVSADWDYARWQQLPDDGNRYEVIDGMLYKTTAPSFFHQWIIKRLERYLGIPAEDRGPAFTVPAPVGVLMPRCDPVQPDYVVVLAERAAIIHDRRVFGVPDLIIEVLSPSNAANDTEVKRNAYAHAGVPEYAIVDLEQRILHTFQLTEPGQYGVARSFAATELITFACLPTIAFRVGDLFMGAPDTTL
ncbi:MAG: Uma2 family endonuclease [Chloroflexaceae bacterium]